MPTDRPQGMTTATSTAAHPGRRSGATVGDGRGLTATGAVVVAVFMGVLGATIDVLSGPGLRTTFTVLFTLGCAAGAYWVHREDLLAAVVIPPLVYAALAAAAAASRAANAGGSFLKQQVLEMVSTLVLHAPSVLLATGAAAVVALARLLLQGRSRS